MAVQVHEGDSLGAGLDAASVANTKILDTPRTKEACRRLGLTLEDLHFRPKEMFAIPGDNNAREKQEMRFRHFEKKRKDHLSEVLAERAKVIAQNAKKGEVPGVQSAQFLSMLESLFEKEAKRLETDLKNQLRSHSSLVKENEEQLRREQEFADRDEHRIMKKDHAKDDLYKKRDERKEAFDAKHEKSVEANRKALIEHQQRQEEYKKEMLAEDERIAKFRVERSQLSAEKSAHWKAKVDGMKETNIQNAILRREKGREDLKRIEAKIQKVTENRENEQLKRQLRSEEQTLHIQDVRQQKDRIDRVNGYRREELKEQIGGNIERIETLLALKDQLLEQRKARTSKAEATRGSRGLNLRRDCLPGPGQYEVQKLTDGPCMKMAKSTTPDFIELKVRETRDNPPPMSYDVDVLPNGQLVAMSGPSVGKFVNNKKESFLDEAMKAKDSVPAPGEYKVESTGLDSRGTVMRRPTIQHEGLDKFSAKRYPVWARPNTDTPGPAGYSVDTFTRKEVMRRAQRSLPNLTKDMLRPQKVVQ
jgi:hypothetical protein|mmetsp:Transcript_81834/g.128890  ORF Transcript_81834/g.128890 Transcript_81834/m.128890 type:complete len:533 (-) Transcript_81834:107-1705(-)